MSHLPPEIDFPVEKIRTRYDVTYHSLGPYGAELFLFNEIKSRIAQWINQKEVEAEYIAVNPYEDDPAITPHDVELPEALQQMETVLSEFSDFFEDENDPDVVPHRIDLKWCSPKVILLSELLFAYWKRDFQGIVFVEQRHVAACLSKMLPRIPPLELYFKSAQLIGHGANSMQKSQMKGMPLRTQQDVVKMFRDGDINLRAFLNFHDIYYVLILFLYSCGYICRRRRSRLSSKLSVDLICLSSSDRLTGMRVGHPL